MKDFWPVLLMTFVVLIAIVILAATPPDRGRVIAVFSPHLEAGALIAAVTRAEARLVAGGGMPGTLVVFSDRPGLPERLKREGALLVLDPLGATGCALVKPPATSPFHMT